MSRNTRRNATAGELLDRLSVVSDELDSLKVLAYGDDTTMIHTGNIDMAKSYVDASINSLQR